MSVVHPDRLAERRLPLPSMTRRDGLDHMSLAWERIKIQSAKYTVY